MSSSQASNRFGIRPGDKVLDAGCGALPFPYATHLADANFSDHSQRFGMPIPRTRRPLYECSIEKMPFARAEFDFVYCAHVLEHVADPAAACRELMRVARRGYIECPRSWTEYIFSSGEHRWLVDLEQNELIFREKMPDEYGDPLGIQYSIFNWMQDPNFSRHWQSREICSLRNVEFYWEGRFQFKIISRRARRNAGVHRWFYSAKHPGERPKTSSELREFLIREFRRLAPGKSPVLSQSLERKRGR